jgi:DNA-binding transcriptional LysR family regulator
MMELRCILTVYGALGDNPAVTIIPTSLSKQIKALENELYTKLFDRTTRQISLTPAGMELSLHAKRMV